MKLILHGKNIEITPAIRSFAEEKFGVLGKLFSDKSENLVQARAELGRPSRHHKSGLVYYAEINIKIGKRLLRASTEHDDLYVAIDRAREEVEKQIKKFKAKTNEQPRRLARKRFVK